MKIVIEDLVRKMSGDAEQELEPGAVIRFEIAGTVLSCKIQDDSLMIYKSHAAGVKESSVTITSVASNVVLVK